MLVTSAMRRIITLPGHAAAGEERFLVEWRHEDDTVWYDILAFSQPGHWAMRLGYPVMRQFQRAYGRDSAKAMVHACINEAELTDAREYGPLLATVP
ncbi:MAG: DUF1990 family protein [Caldilineaceae bacterium]|nr:DUF1990 family protein [Caldilineaceae bacterium]